MLLPLHAQAPLSGRLVALRISNGARDVKDLPTRLKLLNWGVNNTVKGPVTVGPETVKQLSALQASKGYDRVAIDYNHQTVPGSDEFNRIIAQRGSIDPLPVAGYGTPVVIPNDGLYLENIEWTPSGQENARNYSDLSPTPLLNDKGEVVFLHSVALCRQGAVDGLTFFNASFLTSTPTTMKTLDATGATTTTPNSAVDYRSLLCALLQKLGIAIPDAASDADIATMVDQFKAPAPPAKPGEAAAGAAGAAGAADPAKKEEPTPMSVNARLDRMEKDNLIQHAIAQGKVIPLGAAEIDATPITVLRTMVDKLPAGAVPLQARQGGNPDANKGGKITTLTPAQKDICKNMGIKEEKYLEKLNAETPERLVTV